MRNGKWEYTIRAYRPPNQGGGLLIETVHVGTASRDMEISVFEQRMKRGEVSHIEIISHVEPFGLETRYSTDPRAPQEQEHETQTEAKMDLSEVPQTADSDVPAELSLSSTVVPRDGAPQEQEP